MAEDMRYDVRTLAYRKRRGELSKEEVEKYLADLPDDAEHGEPTETRFAANWAARAENAADSE